MELSKNQKLLTTIVNKAWEDEAFKAELVANPIDTIEKLTGQRIRVPEGKTMVVRDQSDDTFVYLNIPPKPNMEDVELGEEQLDLVAGGGGTNHDQPVILDSNPLEILIIE